MHFKRGLILSTVLLFVTFQPGARAATVSIDLAVPDKDRTAEYVKTDQAFDIVIKNALPQYTYKHGFEIVHGALTAPADTASACSKALFRELASVDKEDDLPATLKTLKTNLKDCATGFDDAVDQLTTFKFGQTFRLAGGNTFSDEITRGVRSWPIVIQPKATPAEIDAQSNGSGDRKNVDELTKRTADQPSLIVKRCRFGEVCSGDPIYINNDEISSVFVSGLPPEPFRVRVSAGESWPCSALDSNFREFKESHPTIVIPLHMRAGMIWTRHQEERNQDFGLRAYGLSTRSTYSVKSSHGGSASVSFSGTEAPTRDDLCNSSSANLLATDARRHDTVSILRAGISEIPAIPLMIQGKSELLTIELTGERSGRVTTFEVPIRYQRFWLDAGGFFAFARHVDEDVVKTPLTGADQGNVRVTQIRHMKDINPSTGIVVNVHPGNYPYVAWQFGIAAQQDRLPSYYLGLGLRAREVGKRSLATVAFGVAAVQANRFNGLRLTENETLCGSKSPCAVLPTDSSLLTLQRKYVFEPYLSISLGFSFGGISDRTDVTKGLQ